MAYKNIFTDELFTKKRTMIKALAASVALLATANALADTPLDETKVPYRLNATMPEITELGPIYVKPPAQQASISSFLMTSIIPSAEQKLPTAKMDTLALKENTSIKSPPPSQGVDQNAEKETWSDSEILGDKHSLSLKQKRYMANGSYRNAVKDLYQRQIDEGNLNELGDASYALTLWHSYIEPKMTKYMATGINNTALLTPEKPLINLNMQSIIDCRNSLYAEYDTSQYSGFETYLHVQGCAKEQIKTAFLPYKDNRVSQQDGQLVNVELDDVPLGIANSKYKNDGKYRDAVGSWSKQLFNAKETDGLKAVNYVPMMQAVLNTSIQWRDFKGIPDNNDSDFNEFSLQDPYGPYLNRNMDLLFTCRDTLLPVDGKIENRRQTFDQIMTCWREGVQTAYNASVKLLETDPSNILLDTSSDLATKIYRMDEDYSGYAPYRDAFAKFSIPMKDAGFVHKDIEPTSFVRFVEAHFNPTLKADYLDNFYSIEQKTASSAFLHTNITFVTESRDQILSGKKPNEIQDIKATFNEVQKSALAKLAPVHEHYTQMEKDAFLDSSTTLEQFKLVQRALLDPTVTADDFKELGFYESSLLFGSINENFSAILEARDSFIGDTTLDDKSKAQKVYQLAGEKAEQANDWIFPTIASIFAIAVFGKPLLSGIASGASTINRSRKRRKEEHRRLNSN